MSEKNLYVLDHQERLCSSVEEILEQVFGDNLIKVGESYEAVADRISWPIKIFVYQRMVIGTVDHITENILEQVIDHLECEYADPDGNPLDPTEKIKEAAKALAQAIHDDYVPWMCERTGEVIEYTREEADAAENQRKTETC